MDGRTGDGQTDMTKIKVYFLNFANNPKESRLRGMLKTVF